MPDYTALNTELTTDPKSLGYSGQSDLWCADKLNEVGASSETQNVVSVTAEAFNAAIVQADYDACETSEKELLNQYAAGGTIDICNVTVWANLDAMFSGTTTLTNLTALKTESISRAGAIPLGYTPEYWDVARARAL